MNDTELKIEAIADIILTAMTADHHNEPPEQGDLLAIIYNLGYGEEKNVREIIRRSIARTHDELRTRFRKSIAYLGPLLTVEEKEQLFADILAFIENERRVMGSELALINEILKSWAVGA